MVTNSTVYVLHEYGAPSHYNALIELGKQNGFKVKFRIFSLGALSSALYHRKFGLFIKSIQFLLSLLFRNKTTIILGIAPFNSTLRILIKLLNRHQVYYHTSYTCWDGSNMVYPTNSKHLLNIWKFFLQKGNSHIFAVSNKTKEELIKNKFATSSQISLVYHSLNAKITPIFHSKNNNFIYSGRLIDSKGIKELLSIFERRPNANLTIIGQGPLASLVNEYAEKCNNISYLGYISGLDNLIPTYQDNSFLIMNSIRSQSWEELFGISIIEGMACGCVPLTTDHSGPKEIITSGINGFISKEHHISESIDRAICMSDEEYQILRNNAIERGQDFYSDKIVLNWSKILE